MQARHQALLATCNEVSGAPPKKPAQSVKLWTEKTNGARGSNSRADETILRESREPMSAIAALYRNPDASSSAKKRGFTYAEMLAIVEHSGAPHSIRQGTLSALKARGQWPNAEGPATELVCISLIGMMFHGVCCRSTARWRARRACALGYWRLKRDPNSWSDCPKCEAKRHAGTCAKCGYQGRAKTPDGKANFNEFCRPYMYEIDIEKFRSAARPKEIRHFDARTYAEYKEAAQRGEHPNVTEMPARKPASPAPEPKPPAPVVAPPPKREQPAAAIAPAKPQHRNTGRSEGCHTYRETKAFKDRIEYHVQGCSGKVRAADGSSIFVSAESNPELLRAPMNRALAFKRALDDFTWTTDSAIRSMKFHGFSLEAKPEAESP
jgi:hypothetical protein